jgi:hypothetical protein
MATHGARLLPYPVKPDGSPLAAKYDPAYCQLVRDLAQDGKFPERWCCEIGISMSTLYNWSDRYPEFEAAVTIGWHLLASHYTDKLVSMAENAEGKGQSALLELMRKRFPSLYGKTPRGTLDHFEARNVPVDSAPSAPGALPMHQRTTDDLRARIEQLEKRGKADG